MKKKTVELLWGFSLAILGICTLIICLSSVTRLNISASVKRILGILEIIVMPVTVYSTVMIVRNNHNPSENKETENENKDDKEDE